MNVTGGIISITCPGHEVQCLPQSSQPKAMLTKLHTQASSVFSSSTKVLYYFEQLHDGVVLYVIV